MGNKHNITYNGETKSVSAWARDIGVHQSRIHRLLKQFPPEDAISLCIEFKGRRFGHLLELNGEKHSISEWGRIRGIDPATIRYRMSKGYSIEKCLSPGHYNFCEDDTTESVYIRKLDEEGRLAEMKRELDKQLDPPMRSGKHYKVRWCDRTSHSHTWYTTKVDAEDLDSFLSTHYLAKVVGV